MVLPTIASIAGIAIVWVTGERCDMGDKPSALAAMQRGGDADLDPKLVGSVGLRLAAITVTYIIVFIIISSVILFVSREDFEIGLADNDAEEAIV